MSESNFSQLINKYTLKDCEFLISAPPHSDYKFHCYGEIITFEKCERCVKQPRCDTYAWVDDEVRLLEDEA